MKHFIMIIIAFPILFMGCGETCDTQPEVSFKPVDEQGKAVVGSNGIYNPDSLKATYLQITGKDTTIREITNTTTFEKRDSVFSIYLPSSGLRVLYLSYSTNDSDTLTFTITENKKRQPMCVDITFSYNGVKVCEKCDLNSTHNVIKK